MKELIQPLAFSMPTVCALVCLAMLLLDIYTAKKNKEERKLRLFLSLTFAVITLSWFGLVLFSAFHTAFVCYFSIFLLMMMFHQILIYQFIHFITATSRQDRFNRLHLIVPALMLAFSLVTDLTVPLHQKEAVIFGSGDGNRLFSILYTMTAVAAFIYYSFYPSLAFLRIRRYRRSIENYSADTQRNSLNWIVILQIFTLILIPVPFFGLLLHVELFTKMVFSILAALYAFIYYPIFCYNLLSDNYVLIDPDDENLPDNHTVEIDLRRFIQYIREEKPYLNPHLRITHVALDLCTNRNYVSAFINHTYGVNFSSLINRYRLRELNRLRLSPDHKENTNMELVLMAGFSSYRSYLRAKNREDKAKTLKAF